MNPGDVVKCKLGKFEDGDETKTIVRLADDDKTKCFLYSKKSDSHFVELEGLLELVEPALLPGQKVIVGRHRKNDVGGLHNWIKEMEDLVGKEAEVDHFHGISFESNTAYYHLKESPWNWRREALTPVSSCCHAWVNVGFSSIVMACKHCGATPATPCPGHEFVNVGFASIRMACKHCGVDQHAC